MPTGVYPRTKKGGTVPGGAPPAIEPVREQIKQMSGVASLDELASQVPESTATAPAPDTKRNHKRKVEAAPIDPLMQDPRYVKAIGNLKSFGAPRAIRRGFDAVGRVTKDKDWPLSEDEYNNVEDLFYVAAKRSSFDPTSHWIGMVLLFLLMLAELLVPRLAKYTKLGGGLFRMMKQAQPQDGVEGEEGEERRMM